jgi:gamma-glutamyltranspeptidase/glutathione hydrolase
LERGGNAFDAAVAAAFAATVAEPCLTSLGGGGFLLAHVAREDRTVLLDFFVNAPGRGFTEKDPGKSLEEHFLPIEVPFESTVQVFHAGAGSVAVPGMLRGLLSCHGELCTMGLEDLVAPAVECLDEGVPCNDLQDYLLRILEPILTLTDYGTEIYGGKVGGTLYNPLYRDFLIKGPSHWEDTMHGSGASALESRMKDSGGLLTSEDLRRYAVHRKEPLRFFYRGHEVLTNSPPSFGGTLLKLALKELENEDLAGASPPERLSLLAGAMDLMNRSRSGAGGTTQISVMDSDGNAASMTSSNGSNSGVFMGDAGVMLNNMMGEDDLHPDGFHAMTPGVRVGSMMSPTLIMHNGAIRSVLGSGGSKRIRSAMLQVMTSLIDRGMEVRDAVEGPRAHLDDSGVLQLEPGFSLEEIDAVSSRWPVNLWARKDLYFGGVHTVTAGGGGWGDSRRGGNFIRV